MTSVIRITYVYQILRPGALQFMPDIYHVICAARLAVATWQIWAMNCKQGVFSFVDKGWKRCYYNLQKFDVLFY
ncbi:hypothetical protein D3C84_1203550 [compost metagenome]